MHLRNAIVLAVSAAAQLSSAGIIHRRAPLGTAKIVEELSNVSGRNFCFNYINAQVLLLPDYITIYETKTISKVSNTKVTQTSTEIIGTLRKGTVTTTIYSTVTDGAAVTYNEGPTYTTTIQVTSIGTNTLTVTVPYFNNRRLKRQAPAVPTPLTDSDPLSISAACTKVVNKYPIISTPTGSTTKSTTTTESTTSTSTIVKVQKSTVIIPYSVKTVSGVTTVQGSATSYISTIEYATVTEVLHQDPTITVTGPPEETPSTTSSTPESASTYTDLPAPTPMGTDYVLNACKARPDDWRSLDPDAKPAVLNFDILHPVPGIPVDYYVEEYDFTEEVECCRICWSASQRQQSCLAHYQMGRVCAVVMRRENPEVDGQCPHNRPLGLYVSSETTPYWEGPCSGGYQICRAEPIVPGDWSNTRAVCSSSSEPSSTSIAPSSTSTEPETATTYTDLPYPTAMMDPTIANACKARTDYPSSLDRDLKPPAISMDLLTQIPGIPIDYYVEEYEMGETLCCEACWSASQRQKNCIGHFQKGQLCDLVMRREDVNEDEEGVCPHARPMGLYVSSETSPYWEGPCSGGYQVCTSEPLVPGDWSNYRTVCNGIPL